MNEQLEKFARTTLKLDLAKCTDAQRDMFARMYGRVGVNDNVDTVVDGMDISKLDWAMVQVTRTLEKK